MSDGDLREHERRAAQGDEEARAALLIERLRAGDIDRAQLALLAWLGHPAARRACPDSPGGEGLLGLLEVLAEAGVEACLRLVLAATRTQAAFYELRSEHLEFVADVEAWLVAWSESSSVSRQSLERLLLRRPADPPSPLPELSSVLEALLRDAEDSEQVAQAVVHALDPAPVGAEPSPVLVALGERTLAQLAPWLLGEGDPVRDRLRAWEEARSDPRYRVERWVGNDYGEAFETLVDHYYDVLDAGSGRILLRFEGTYTTGMGISTDYSGVERVEVRDGGLALVWTAGNPTPERHWIPKRPARPYKRRFQRQRLNYDGSRRTERCKHGLHEGCARCH